MQSEAYVGKVWVPTIYSFKHTAKSFNKFETLKKLCYRIRMMWFLGLKEIEAYSQLDSHDM